MARKPEDIFIVGAESPEGEDGEPQAVPGEAPEPRNPFAPAPEEERAPRRAPRGRLRRPPALACGAALLAVGLAVFALSRPGGSAPSPRQVGPPAPVARVAAAPRAMRPPRQRARPARRPSEERAGRRAAPRPLRRRARKTRVPQRSTTEAPAAPVAPPVSESPPASLAPEPPAPASAPRAVPGPRPEFGIER